MNCPKCGNDFDTRFCPNCGYSPEAAEGLRPARPPEPPPLSEPPYFSQPQQAGYQPPPIIINNNMPQSTQALSPKKKWVAFFLCLFFGVFGVHRFYVGKIGTGLLYFFTLGFYGIATLIDLIMILTGSFTDKQRNFLI